MSSLGIEFIKKPVKQNGSLYMTITNQQEIEQARKFANQMVKKNKEKERDEIQDIEGKAIQAEPRLEDLRFVKTKFEKRIGTFWFDMSVLTEELIKKHAELNPTKKN